MVVIDIQGGYDYIQFLFENLPDMEIPTHPELLEQMLPRGNSSGKTLCDKQNEAPDFNVGCLLSW